MAPTALLSAFKRSLLLDNRTSQARFRRRQATIYVAQIALDAISRLQNPKLKRWHRKKLVRGNLLPNPRFQTPWQQLYHSRDNRAFITTMGVDTRTFRLLLANGFHRLWTTTPIPRNDVPLTGQPRPSCRSLDSAGALGLVLHWLRSAAPETALLQIFALVPSVLERYLNFSLSILVRVLRGMVDARITWPSAQRMEYYSSLIHARHPRIDGAFGFMDGLSLPVSVSAVPQLEKATYNGWLHTHKISNIFVFAPDGTPLTHVLCATYSLRLGI